MILPSYRPLARKLAGLRGWRRLYGDRYAVVFERTPEAAAPAPQPM